MTYEHAEEYQADAYTITGWASGIAWYVNGWQTEPAEDTEWTGFEVRTGQLVCTMVGDNRHFSIDPEDVTELSREDYCGICGQVGCAHDGLERAAVS